eukprot:363186-Chlamydomonas_euryale.AAC.8
MHAWTRGHAGTRHEHARMYASHCKHNSPACFMSQPSVGMPVEGEPVPEDADEWEAEAKRKANQRGRLAEASAPPEPSVTTMGAPPPPRDGPLSYAELLAEARQLQAARSVGDTRKAKKDKKEKQGKKEKMEKKKKHKKEKRERSERRGGQVGGVHPARLKARSMRPRLVRGLTNVHTVRMYTANTRDEMSQTPTHTTPNATHMHDPSIHLSIRPSIHPVLHIRLQDLHVIDEECAAPNTYQSRT